LGRILNLAIRIIVITGAVVTAGLGILWGYTSFMYNWLNIGGGTDDIEFWESMRGTVPYIAFFMWALISVGVFLLRKFISPSRVAQRLVCASIAAVGPICLVVSDWYFHRGFPLSPV
jgi:hypothetical protein